MSRLATNTMTGFQEGGEFTSIISIRAKDRSQANTLKIEYVTQRLDTHNKLTTLRQCLRKPNS
jgi:hypothetical protein